MKLVLMTLTFQIPGCRSLKEKRSVLSGLRERFGRLPNLAVCESDYQDIHDRAQWSFVAMAGNGKIVDKILNQVEAYADDELDAVLIGSRREVL